MLHRMYKSSATLKFIFIATAMILSCVPDSFGRGALKLYSVLNNSSWNSAKAWSLTSNGAPTDYMPQENDTVIIDRSVTLNSDFSFAGNGFLLITTTGIVRGDNMNLSFTGNSTLLCSGEVKIGNLSIADRANLRVESSGKVIVKNSLSDNSVSEHYVAGKITISGSCINNSVIKISGAGSVLSGTYNGTGAIAGISPSSSIPNGSLLSEFNWIGAANTNWNDPLNWAGRVNPSDNSNVAILNAGNSPEVSDKGFTNDLYINSGSSLTINPDALININGNLSVSASGKFLLKNTVSKKSALFFNGEATGTIQSEYQVLKGQKNLVSSPVGMAYSKTFLNMYLRSYDESSSQWGSYILPTNDPLPMMKGYELYSLSSETRTFVGTPDIDAKSYAISNSGNGLNLTGNPFPCYIDWENNDNNAWQRNSIGSAIYYPDPSGSGNFSVYLPGGEDAVSLNSGSRFIAPMQGFFVKAVSQGSLVVTKNSRVSNTTEPSYPTKNNGIKFKLQDSAGLTDEVLFRVLDKSTFGFDELLDAVKIQNSTDAPSLALLSESDVKYAINTIPAVNSSLNIPVVIDCKKAGEFSISITGGSTFEYRYPVILEDKLLAKFIDLRSVSVYSFYHSPEMNSNRFEIHFYSPQAIAEQPDTDHHSDVTITPGEIQVIGNSSDNTTYTATLFSIDGKRISTTKGSLAEGITLSTGNYASQVCVLQLNDGINTITKKIYTK